MIGPLLLLAFGLGIAATAATVAVAASAVSHVELTRWVSHKLRGAPAAAHALQDPGGVLATASAVTTLGALAASAAVPALLAQAPPTVLGLASVFVIVPLLGSAAYFAPRVVGRRWPEQIVGTALPWIERAGRLLAPFLPRRDPSARGRLAAVLSGDSSILAATDEIEVVSGVLAFADRSVAELMTPRTAIVAIPEGMLAAEAAHAYTQAGYSRYPVYRGSLDEIVGVAHAFDLLLLAPDAAVPIRPVLTVPGTQRAADLMLEMQRGRGHLAVVLDEFGGTAGLVTFEDLLRDLVKEVLEGTESSAQGTDDGQLVELEGGAPATVLEERFGRQPGGRGAQSVGGLLIQALGRIPRTGERFLLGGLEFDVLAASVTRVERVAVRPGPVRTVPLDRGEGG